MERPFTRLAYRPINDGLSQEIASRKHQFKQGLHGLNQSAPFGFHKNSRCPLDP